MQIYALTSRPIVSALASAKRRGMDVRVIVDRSQMCEDRSDANAVQRLAAAHIPVLVDAVAGLMHDKVMIIDGGTVLSGSFNYTWSAEHRNAENLLIISEPVLAAQFAENWDARGEVTASYRSSRRRTAETNRHEAAIDRSSGG